VKRYALVVESDQDFCVAGRNVGDAVVLNDRVKIGRSWTCDVVIEHRMVNRTNCTLERTAQGFIIEDMGGQNGVWVNDRRIRSRQLLSDGDEINYPGVRLALRVVSDDPFARLGRFRDFVLFGTAHIESPGRRRAFRRINGATQRVLIVTLPTSDARLVSDGPLFAPLIDEIADGALLHRVYPDHAGVPAKAFLDVDNNRHSTGDIAADVRMLIAGVLGPITDMNFPERGCVITWDGDVRHIHSRHGSVPLNDARPRHVDRARLAEVVRNLFPSAWAREQVLREQLETLDDHGIAWLLQRGDAR
jgi:hypothetical protein